MPMPDLTSTHNRSFLLAFVCIAMMSVLSSCDENYVPRPRGYFRIDLPEKSYINYSGNCPVEMEIPAYSKVELFKEYDSADSCWFNLVFPKNNARIYCTYLPVQGDVDKMISDSYAFAFKHEMKADAITRTAIQDDERKVYGLIYDIKGEAASQVQFFLTDSSQHFLRGALYFSNRPNQDSLAPVLSFLRDDIQHLTETLVWR
ncbi:MAG: gliding motility lipoprotein GldD [Bacteroidota bacterium]